MLMSIRFISFFTRTAADVDGSCLMMLRTFASAVSEVVAEVQFTNAEDDDAKTDVSDLLVCVDVGAVLIFLLLLS